MGYDLIIRNGLVVDGSGGASFAGDVGIIDGRIATIGKIKDRGVSEIDAEGHVVTPGFIDVHTHFDAQVFWDELGTNSCWHRVTTVVMGHCGFTLAPPVPEHRMLVVRNLERAEDISGAAMEAGIDWGWTTFSQYLGGPSSKPGRIQRCPRWRGSATRVRSPAGDRPANASEPDRR